MSKVDEAQVRQAVEALVTFLENSLGGKNELLGHDEFLYLVVGLMRTPDRPIAKPYPIPLPNSLYRRDDVDVCFISKDPQVDWEQKIDDSGARISQVVSVGNLKKEYKSFESKRKLRASFDFFLCDKSVVRILPKELGKTFISKKQLPIGVEFKKGASPENVKKQIEKALDCTYLRISGGSCCQIAIAKSSFEVDAIVENIMAGIEEIGRKVPKKWHNIQSIHVKTHASVSLPLYTELPAFTHALPSGEVYEKPKRGKRKRVDVVALGVAEAMVTGGSGEPKKKKKKTSKKKAPAGKKAASKKETSKKKKKKKASKGEGK